ncbi:MAG: hypothetical protein ABI175_14810, partial [Polyangiales bacterium]
MASLCLSACGTSTPAVESDTREPEVVDAAAEAATDAPAEISIDAPTPSTCDEAITAPPASLGLDPFYVKYLDADGVPIVGSTKPSDASLRIACRIARQMLSFRADVRAQMVKHHARIAVMARTEVTTDVPEHADLYTAFPGTDWNKRARGLGGTVDRPATSCAEENLLCDATDPYVGENILVHEFGHGMVNLGVAFADKTFVSRLKSAYDAAIAAGKWKNTYAGSNVDEYFAEGVQDYFETNIESIPSNGIHNEIDTRAELETYDPAL